MPLPPVFKFQERSGKINWRTLMNTDLDQIIRETDLRQIEQILQNVTYAEVDREDLEKVGDAHFVKLFRISQLSIEYLIYTQNYLETLTKSLDVHYKHEHLESQKTKEAFKEQANELQALKRELAVKTKTLKTYEHLLKQPYQQESEYLKCN